MRRIFSSSNGQSTCALFFPPQKPPNQGMGPHVDPALEPALRSPATNLLDSEHARHTLNAIETAVLSTDLVGRVTDLNPAASAMTGWTRQAALGQPLREVCRIIDAATRAQSPGEDARGCRCLVRSMTSE